jgi:CDGSH-type Zn-finger protein
VTIVASKDGPYEVSGPLTVASSDGRTSIGDARLLCRCGGSARKPWCDGSHRRNGFAG